MSGSYARGGRLAPANRRCPLPMLYRICGRLRRLLGGGRKLTGSDDFDGPAAFVAHARRRHMTRRLPLFAAVWLGVAVGWNVVLCLESLLTPLLAVLILPVQAAVAGRAVAA